MLSITIFFDQNESLTGSDINRQIIDWRTAWEGHMTYCELNDLFFKTWADKHGIIRGKPVMLIYRMNHAAGAEGLDAVVDESLLAAELKKADLTLMREGEENDLICVHG